MLTRALFPIVASFVVILPGCYSLMEPRGENVQPQSGVWGKPQADADDPYNIRMMFMANGDVQLFDMAGRQATSFGNWGNGQVKVTATRPGSRADYTYVSSWTFAITSSSRLDGQYVSGGYANGDMNDSTWLKPTPASLVLKKAL